MSIPPAENRPDALRTVQDHHPGRRERRQEPGLSPGPGDLAGLDPVNGGEGHTRALGKVAR